MAVDSRSFDFEDPFAGSSLLSFLPRNLGVPLYAGAPQSEEQEMKCIQNFLDSFILRGSKTVLEQAEAICNSNREVVHSSQVEKMMSPGGKDQLLGRRPALGRKRPRFSLKPISSNSIPDVDFNSQIDQLDDPEEYFKAFDQHENAEKELKKLRGEIPNQYANNQHITVPKRRPGILGKTASFKHQYSAMVMLSSSQDLDKIDMSLDVSINSKSNIRSNHISSGQAFNQDSIDPNNSLYSHRTRSSTDSAGGNEKNGNNLLEKLLCSFKDLDEAEGTALLKESLQIKSIEVEKICLLELDNIQKIENKPSKDEVVKQQLESRQLKQKSPTIGTSPLAAISNLLRRTSVNDPMEDQYLNFPSDDSQDGSDLTPTNCQQKMSLSPSAEPEVSCPDPNSLDTYMYPVSDDTSSSLVNKLHNSVTKTDKINDANIVAEKEETESGHQLDENTRHRHHEMTEEQSTSEGFKSQIKDKAEQIQLDQLSDEPDPEVGSLASCCINNYGLDSTPEITDEDCMLSGKDNAKLQVNVGTSVESSAGPCKENSTQRTFDEQHKGVSISAGEDVEKHGYATSGISQNSRKYQKTPSRSKNKKEQEWVSKRKSLADAGTKFEFGLRRSTRKHFRPLEYWRGERFLYGRIHDSLATVIGVKYCSSSPGQDGKMKVKSYVSEQYADLVAQAARY